MSKGKALVEWLERHEVPDLGLRIGEGAQMVWGEGYDYGYSAQQAELTADRDKWRDRCERLVSWYGHPQEWRCNVSRYNYGHECSLDECVKREYNSGSHGFSFAQQIQKEIDDDTTRTS